MEFPLTIEQYKPIKATYVHTDMTPYEQQVQTELLFWQQNMQKEPSLVNRLSKGLQDKVNSIIPEKVHKVITTAIKQMVNVMMYGAEYVAKKPRGNASLALREAYIRDQISFYKRTASVEGAVTGAGGLLLGLADFPLLFSLKIKLLYDIASWYGHDVGDYRERLYMLYIFQLSFASQKRRNQVYKLITDWEEYRINLPADMNDFDWRTFQQEYRDYIDLAKLAQLIPVIGAPVGAIVNYQLIDKLGDTACNAYRMRWFSVKKLEE